LTVAVPLSRQRESLQVRAAFEAGIENVVAFLTEGITAQQLEMLASLMMDKKKCRTAEIY
jgi:acetamidase/formamidase